MDYEREPEPELGNSASESELPTAVGGDAVADETSSALSSGPTPDAPTDSDATVPATATEQISAADDDLAANENELIGAATTASPDQASSDLDSDADVLDDSFSTPPTPPEWPAADLVITDVATADEAERDIAAAYAASSESSDLGDDSDAPVLTDDPSDDVNMNQGGVQSINAKTVTFSQGGAARVRAEEMNVSQSGVGLARVGNLTLSDGASAFAVVADEATVESGSNAFLIVARSFNGETRPTIDWRTAAAFGAGIGLVISIFRRIR